MDIYLGTGHVTSSIQSALRKLYQKQSGRNVTRQYRQGGSLAAPDVRRGRRLITADGLPDLYVTQYGRHILFTQRDVRYRRD